MTTSPNVELVEIDAWELRCIFNESLLLANVALGALTMVPKKPQRKPGSRTWIYRDKNDDDIATVHFFERDGIVVSPPDPKSVKVGNIRYVLHDKDDKANPEKRLFKSLEWRKRYGCFRKLKCCASGPLGTASFVSLKVTSSSPSQQPTLDVGQS